MKQRNKWLKAMSIALSCAVLATTAPMNVLATEVSAELQNNTLSEGIIANDETGIPDAGLYRWMLVFADSNDDGILTVEEAEALEEAECSWYSISNIKGIEYCKNLRSVTLNKNIKDLSPLANLTNLTNLNLSDNDISDINELNGLTNLTNLTSLDLSGNNIKDLSPLANLTNLTSIDLSNNDISDISELKESINLISLSLSGNWEISDISALEQLTNLKTLSLGGHYGGKSPLTDITVLANLTDLTSLSLTYTQLIDVSPLANLTNLTSLYLNNNKITDVSMLADLALKYNLKEYSFDYNNITNVGNFPQYVVYDEEVEIRYLADDDKNRIIELLGLSEYDGKVICMDSKRNMGYQKFYPYGDSGYGYDYDILRTDNGDLTLGKIVREEDNDGRYSFSGSYGNYDDVKLTISYENNNVWLFCCGDVDSSGLKFTDKVEKTKIVEPFAKSMTGTSVSKSFEREFGEVLSGKLNEQDVQTVKDYFGFESYSGDFAIIPTEGAEYKIDFSKSSYGKDELSALQIEYYSLTRIDGGRMGFRWLDSEWYAFKNGKLSDSDYHRYDEEITFLTKGDIGTDIEDCVFYIPAMDKDSDEVILAYIKLSMLNEYTQGNLMVYNDEKTLEVCNFTEVKEPEDEEDNATPNDSYEVTLPTDKTTISASDFAAVLAENKTKDVVIKSNNNITFTFAKGTMASVDGMESYDFGTTVVSDFANAGNMGSSVTKDNFVTRINYNYSGKLPAKADIKIYVGTDWVGKTLHYSYIMENGLKHLQSVMVDAEGYITVTQDHCSDYVVTTNKLSTNEPEDTTTPDNTDKTDDTTSSSPDTGDQNNIFTYVTMLVCGVGALLVAMQKKKLSR